MLAFERIVADLGALGVNLYDFSLYAPDGTIRTHRFQPCNRCNDSYSVAKAFTMTAVGLLWDDGLLDVVMVENVTKAMIPGALVKLMQGKILRQRYTLHDRTEHIRTTFEGKMAIQVDGELYDDLLFDVRIVPNRLRMYRR